MSEKRRRWSPRMWQGCDLPAWLRLLSRNNFAVSPKHWYIAGIVGAVSLTNGALRLVQDQLFGPRADRPAAPLFILGHWRTGTTLLHELLMRDPRLTSPTYAQCMGANHFLLTTGLLKRLGKWLLPTHRPMDNMRIGWDNPQEDEFALCMLGEPSPYYTIAFPNNPPMDQDAYDLERLPRAARERWKRTLTHFLKLVSVTDPRRLVLKSPTHSCRVPTLLEMFPEAQFVHIVRDPFVVFPSTVNLWRSLAESHGLQTPTHQGVEERVFATFTHLYERLEAGKKLIPAGRFFELRYEDLVADPLGKMERLYAGLGLEGYDEAAPRFAAYLAENAGYATNKYPALGEERRAEIRARWGPVIERYGYG